MQDMMLSIFILSIAFSNLIGGSLFQSLLISFTISVLCFFIHEMAHRTSAKYFGFSAKYVAWPLGLFFALVSSFFGFIFAAPGAVRISPYSEKFAFVVRPMTKKEYGIISASGPISNILIGIIFLFIYSLYPLGLFILISKFSFWLSFFNLLPIPPLDGIKVFLWDYKVYLLLFSISFLGFVFLG